MLLPSSCVLCGAAVPLRIASGTSVDRVFASTCPRCLASVEMIEGETCERCGRGLISEDGLCVRCRGRDGTNRNIALVEYRGTAKEVLATYKLAGHRRLSIAIADLLLARLESVLRHTVVVPVPSSPERRSVLGWDPVAALLCRIAAEVDLSVAPLLKRRRGRQQKELGFEERVDNARRLFATAGSGTILQRTCGCLESGRGLFLFDDVYTTGATIEACRSLLEEAGIPVSGSVTVAVD